MTKILILGGGFGGLRAVLDLEKKLKNKFEITLVDRNSYHLFVPALYEVASAYGIKQDPFAVRLKKTVCIPYSDIFENKKINFIQAEIFSIDTENKKVATRGGEILDYDYLVIALGSQMADFGLPGVREYAFQFKVLEDGLVLNQKIEELTKEISSGVRTPPIKVAVVGAGFTGIEVAAELSCCVKKFARACNIKSRCEKIVLIEAASQILPAVADKEREIIVRRLTKLGVEITAGVMVEEVKSDGAKLKSGKTLETDLVIWTAGVKAPDILKDLSTSNSLLANGKIKVDDYLAVVGLNNTFAVGDNIEFLNRQTGKPIPALAYIAVDQGKIAAENILRGVKNRKLKKYDPFFGIWIAPVGGKYALAHLWGFTVKGFFGWTIRELVDFRYMLSILPIKKAISLFWQEMTLFTKND